MEDDHEDSLRLVSGVPSNGRLIGGRADDDVIVGSPRGSDTANAGDFVFTHSKDHEDEDYFHHSPTFKKHPPPISKSTSVGGIRRISKAVKLLKTSLTTSQDSFVKSSSVGSGGSGSNDNKSWKWSVLGKRTVSIQKQLHLNPDLPFEYAKNNLVNLLKELIKESRHVVHQADRKRNYLLHYAVVNKSIEMVDMLLDLGADISVCDARGNQPLHLAACDGDLDMFRYLLARRQRDTSGKMAMHVIDKNDEGKLPIHILCQNNFAPLLKELIDIEGPDLNVTDDSLWSPMHYCCAHDSIECLDLLLTNGANLFQSDRHRAYPVHIAAESSSPSCLKALLARERSLHAAASRFMANKKVIKPPFDRNPLEEQIELLPAVTVIQSRDKRSSSAGPGNDTSADDNKVIPKLLELTDDEGETPLHSAVRAGNLAGTEVCLSAGANILATQQDLDTPIHYACNKCDMDSLDLIFKWRPKQIVQSLSMANKSGYTPLHLATLYDFVDLVGYLIELGAPLEQTDSTGLTPLLLGVTKASFNSVNRLVQGGSNLEASDQHDRTIVHIMILYTKPNTKSLLHLFQKDSVRSLLSRKDSFGSNCLHYAARVGHVRATQKFLGLGLSILDRNTDGDNPMHIAAQAGWLEVARLMLASDQGVRAIYQGDCYGRIPLHRAIKEGRLNVTQLLLDRGGIFRKCHYGNTPLMVAAWYNQLKICQLVLELAPGSLDSRNKDKYTALHHAAREGHSEIVDFLLTAGASIVPSNTGIYFVTLALVARHQETLRTIVLHPRAGKDLLLKAFKRKIFTRWTEIWTLLDGTDQCVLNGLIREMPNLFVTTYDFSVLQRHAFRESEDSSGPLDRIKVRYSYNKGHALYATDRQFTFENDSFPSLVLKLLENEMLSKTIVSAWVRWDLVKIFPLDDFREEDLYQVTFDQTHVTKFQQKFAKQPVLETFNWIVWFLALIHLIQKFVSIKLKGFAYALQYPNLLEIALCLFIISAIFVDSIAGYQTRALIGAGAMFLAWFCFLLQIARVDRMGVFIAMFIQVFWTVTKCLSIFSIIIVGYGFVFHILLRRPSNNSSSPTPNVYSSGADWYDSDSLTFERDQFNHLALSIFKTVMMMFGEFEYSQTILNIYVNDKEPVYFFIVTTVFFMTFLVLVPIVLMNLLIGLAVGDIEELRKTACQRSLSERLLWLVDIETRFPNRLRQLIFKPNLTVSKKKNKKLKEREETPSQDDTINSTEMRIANIENAIRSQGLLLESIAGQIENARLQALCECELMNKQRNSKDKGRVNKDNLRVKTADNGDQNQRDSSLSSRRKQADI